MGALLTSRPRELGMDSLFSLGRQPPACFLRCSFCRSHSTTLRDIDTSIISLRKALGGERGVCTSRGLGWSHHVRAASSTLPTPLPAFLVKVPLGPPWTRPCSMRVLPAPTSGWGCCTTAHPPWTRTTSRGASWPPLRLCRTRTPPLWVRTRCCACLVRVLGGVRCHVEESGACEGSLRVCFPACKTLHSPSHQQ